MSAVPELDRLWLKKRIFGEIRRGIAVTGFLVFF